MTVGGQTASMQGMSIAAMFSLLEIADQQNAILALMLEDRVAHPERYAPGTVHDDSLLALLEHLVAEYGQLRGGRA